MKGKVNFIFALMIIMITAGCTTKTIPLEPRYVVNKKLICRIDPSTYITDSIIVSHDNRHVAYQAFDINETNRNRKDVGVERIVLDGNEGPFYFHITSIHFSPDSRRMAYIICDKPSAGCIKCGHRIIVDAKEGKRYLHIPDGFDIDYPLFSPDSRHLAYLVITPDQSRNNVTWLARRWPNWQIVLDDQEDKIYNEILGACFNPETNQTFYFAKSGENTLPLITALKVKPMMISCTLANLFRPISGK